MPASKRLYDKLATTLVFFHSYIPAEVYKSLVSYLVGTYPPNLKDILGPLYIQPKPGTMHTFKNFKHPTAIEPRARKRRRK